ncbi:MAG: alanine--tRNA ligase-related protein [Patescibacteria group bacterium]
MTSHLKIRQIISDFWKSRGHVEVPGIPLVPQNDPTTLFTGSGMQQFVPNLLGEPHPQGTRIFNIQRCLRAQDIEEVGDNRHDTFFEMVGNWSLGDYFKKEQLPWMFELYTSKDHGFGLDSRKLYVTVFTGGSGVAKDEDAINIWKEIFTKAGLKCEVGTQDSWHKDQRITLYDAKKNWWSRAGAPSEMPIGEIGGPDSELFYDFGEDLHDEKAWGKPHPNSDSGRFLEIGNSVFIQFKKNEKGEMVELPKKNVDFGGGFERILAAINDDPDVFKTDVFSPIISSIATDYDSKSEKEKSQLRIIADHIRSATNLVADGIEPGPNEQGYITRRLIRRAVRAAQKLNIGPDNLVNAVEATQSIFAEAYEPIKNPKIKDVVSDEIHKYIQTLENGRKMIERFVAKSKTVTGKDIFDLYQSSGVPTDEVTEIAKDLGAEVNLEGLEEAKKAHADASRAGSEQKFKGGLADHSEQVVKYHTATHLLHKALENNCGPTVRQEGSNITGERLRFDFRCDHKPTPDEIQKIENEINQKIQEALPVNFVVLPKTQAEKLGAKSFFREKYPDEVKVYFIGPTIEKLENLKSSPTTYNLQPAPYSLEFCGGPHVSNTKEIGPVKVKKVEKIGKDIFRIYVI